MQIDLRPIITLILLIILTLLLFGCRSKVSTSERTQISDTLVKTSYRYVSQPINTTITIDEICDTLGNVRKFSKSETSGQNQSKIRTENNQLFIDLLTGLSETKTDTIYKTAYKNIYKDREVIKYRTPFWIYPTFILLILIILFLLKKSIFA